MKYTLKTLIFAICLLSSMTVYSASQVNWFNRTTTQQQSQSRWSPVSSNLNVTSSRINDKYDYVNRRYYSGGGSYIAPVTNRSYYSTNLYQNQSVRAKSVASKTHYNTYDLRKNSMFNASLADNSNLEFASNSFFEDGESDGDNRPTRSYRPSVGGPSENPGVDTNPGLPLTDAVPCLVIMILAVAVVKYRKLH